MTDLPNSLHSTQNSGLRIIDQEVQPLNQTQTNSPSNSSQQKIFALSLSAGASKAVFQAIVLQEIERQTGKKIHELFDYIAGSSAGAINALLLTYSEEFTATDLLQFYKTKLPNVFKISAWQKFKTCFGLFAPQFQDKLHKAATETFGNSRLANSLTNVMIMSYSITNDCVKMFKSWDLREDGSTALIALASGNVPGLFQGVKVGNEFFVDGALSAGNPSAALLSQIFRHNSDVEETNIKMLSIGTGQLRNALTPESSLFRWIYQKNYFPLLNIFLENLVSNEIVKSIIGDNNFTYFNCSLDVDQYNGGTNPSKLQDLISNAEAWRDSNMHDITEICKELMLHYNNKVNVNKSDLNSVEAAQE